LPYEGSINAFLINTGSRLVLIDSGAGELYGDYCGHLPANLRAAGYTPEQVDEVLLTHLHADHVGGLTVDDNAAADARTRVHHWIVRRTWPGGGTATDRLGPPRDSAWSQP